MKPLLYSAVFALAGLASPGSADELMAEYYAYMGPNDFLNSSGARLSDFSAILQQDRANYHRFNRRDQWDQDDPLFADRQMRALIPELLALSPSAIAISDALEAGESYMLWIRVYGVNGVPLQVYVEPAAG